MDAKAVAQELAASAKEAAGKLEISSMTVEIGELATISAPALAKEISLLLPRVSIDMEEKKAKVKCECGFEGAAKIKTRGAEGMPDFCCPKCAKKYPQVLEGDSVELKDIEVQ